MQEPRQCECASHMCAAHTLWRAVARAWHASSPPTVAGNRGARRDATAEDGAAGRALGRKVGSVRSDLLWAS
eukprot:1992009-Prymnesium_polylepis.1